MAALTEEQLAILRMDVGDEPSDDALQDIYDRVGSVARTAEEVIRTRLANMLAAPLSFSVPGEYSENRGENLKAMMDLLKRIEGQVRAEEGMDGVTSSRLVRNVEEFPQTEEGIVRMGRSGRGR